jgi:cyclic pyranopterin phosphate synthase
MGDMSERVIPLIDERQRKIGSHIPVIPAKLVAPNGLLADTRGRQLHDLRISVTDRCNFRCTYCMPKEVFDKDYPYLSHGDLLSFEEITRLAKIYIEHGVEKIRLTGGEPLLRKHLERLIEQLASLRTLSGKPLDLTLTTNGSLLRKKARALKDAGLTRMTVSLDGLDDTVFQQMNDVGFPVGDVLDGIEAAREVGFENIKVNMVVKKGTNEHEIIPMAKYFKGSGVILRFIEFMDVGASNGWNMTEVLPSAEVIEKINSVFPLTNIDPNSPGEVAERWRYLDGSGEVGVISSVTQAFCKDCSRARLSTEGKMYLCLFATEGHDLKALLREGKSDLEISNAIAQVWSHRTDRYSELRGSPELAGKAKVEMSYIGG